MFFKRIAVRILVMGLLVVGAAAFGGVLVRLPEAAASPRAEAAASAARQTGTHRAGLVVRFDDNNVVTKCVTFSEPFIDGKQLLERSGLTIGFGDDGAVCSVENAGCPVSDCFCQCPFPECNYWAYYNWQDGAWQYSPLGAGWTDVEDGSLQGWSWGPGNWVSGVEPPAISFEQVCQVAGAATSTPTATATATQPVSQGQTATPTATATTQSGAVPLPQVNFQADSRSVPANTCTVLQWVTWDATQVTLNGAPVNGQDRQEVCPSATQTFELVATNGAGQTSRQIVIEVTGAAQPTPLPTQPLQPTYIAPTTDPAQFGGAATVDLQPTVPVFDFAATPPVEAQADFASDIGIATSPTVQAVPTSAFTFEPTATLTPRPRRILGADGRPTPTPMLVARAAPRAAASLARDTTAGPPMLPTEDRSFRATLLPGYAAYLVIAASLVAACVWVIRRRGSSGRER